MSCWSSTCNQNRFFGELILVPCFWLFTSSSSSKPLIRGRLARGPQTSLSRPTLTCSDGGGLLLSYYLSTWSLVFPEVLPRLFTLYFILFLVLPADLVYLQGIYSKNINQLTDKRCGRLSSRYCMQVALQHRERLASSWDCLPKHLLHSLQQRVGRVNTPGS